MKIQGIKYSIDIMNTLEGSKRFADRCIKLHAVVLGDNGKYWIVCAADAQRLVKIGYEIAR